MAIKSSNQITFSEHKKIVEIREWYLASSANTGVTKDTPGWTTNIQTIDYTNKYLWNYEEVIYSIGSSDISDPVIIGFYGQGESGKGISDIKNYYVLTETPELPESPKWSDDVSITLELSPTKKYLWNCEEIIYTSGNPTRTSAAIIGVYGDSGADAITFEIYSSYGFMFKEDMDSIELKIAAFKGSEEITDATYTWSWWNKDLNNGDGGYSIIMQDTIEKSFMVNKIDTYAFSSLKCTMTYNGQTYEDYIALINETIVYTSIVKFFDGSNIFYSDDLYLVAYIELYKNNDKIETILTDQYCSGVSTISNGTIISNITGSFANGDLMYFICKNNNLYEVVLGEYSSGIWNVVNNETKYTYINTLYPAIHSNVIAISKESINKAQTVDFSVLKGAIPISNTSVNIIDSNDPIVSNKVPENPVYNQLWLDTSVTPHILKIFIQIDGTEAGEWVECTEKIGGNIFTSKPTSYAAGDLWILASGETCGEFGPGSMLKSTTNSNVFNTSHWIDADKENTELKNNIKQYFAFDSNNGLRIGQNDDKFYVNISSTEMGFYDNEKGQHQRVVKISNNSATIQSAKLKGNTEFYGQINMCDPTLNPEDNIDDTLFIWKIEANKSLSLAIAT